MAVLTDLRTRSQSRAFARMADRRTSARMTGHRTSARMTGHRTSARMTDPRASGRVADQSFVMRTASAITYPVVEVQRLTPTTS
ncbi:hypothetical protein GCM10009850_059400 [Nonomuraea monospora]|uniref:Uncharacterized protein n=1 Tax=Nonomuraea monospora TaxID=568818 RepID=A0ABP5PFE8_9ACTN